jgi:hypothetical protein
MPMLTLGNPMPMLTWAETEETEQHNSIPSTTTP